MKELTGEQKFMKDQVEGFKDFVLDSMDEGIHEDFEDHYVFLAACLETYATICSSDDDFSFNDIKKMTQPTRQ